MEHAIRRRLGAACALWMGVAACAPAADPVVSEADIDAHTQALGGREGKLEFAIDAPWRLEPVQGSGQLEHGAIPIAIAVHDVNFASEDGNYDYVRDFLSMRIEETSPHGRASQRVHFDDLREVEATWGAWQLTGRPPHQVCEPEREGCGHMRSLEGSSAWFATYWYVPQTGAETGDDIDLTVTLYLEAGLGFSVRNDEGEIEYKQGPGQLQLRNHLRVHLGEAPLPRFDETGWVYGDLHYHSQHTDNEGEAGYGYRSTLRAMGSLGLDFAFATEHASNSSQITDLDLDWERVEHKALRDMSPERFVAALEHLHGEKGANTAVLDNPAVGTPQSVRQQGVAPRLFLGGEVDAIPEITRSEVFASVSYGNGLSVDVEDFCVIPPCNGMDKVVESPYGGYGVLGWAGFQEEFTRQHLVYMPSDARDEAAFVPSNTTSYGGGGRWLPDVLRDIERHGYAFLAHPLAAPNTGMTHAGPDMFPYSRLQYRRALRSPAILGLQLWNENPRLQTSIGEGDSVNTGAFNRSAGIERGTPSGRCEQLESGNLRCVLELVPQWDVDGFQWQRSGTPTYGADDTDFAMEEDGRGLYSNLHHGTFALDELLRDGLDPDITQTIDWLQEGEPRRFFLAGGSDAHGDLGYRRAGYFFGVDEVNSTVIGSPRNLVFVGAPDARSSAPNADQVATKPTLKAPVQSNRPWLRAKALEMSTAVQVRNPIGSTTPLPTLQPLDVNLEVLNPSRASHEAPVQYGQTQIVEALRSGNFSVTDGPALRIVVDRNRNGEIDAPDVPMGGILHLYDDETELPLLVEWASSPEFGPVVAIDLYVGAVNEHAGRTYAPDGHGVRTPNDPQSTIQQTLWHHDGQVHQRMRDGYYRDQTGQLRIQLPAKSWDESRRAYTGVRAVTLDLRRFPASIATRDGQDRGYYVRAFAKTEPKNWAACVAADRELFHRRGQCLERFAYTNPIWAMRKPAQDRCYDAERALDRDGDHWPDYCDGCPDIAGPNCVALPPTEGDDMLKRLGGPLADEAQSVALDEEGNVYVAGHFQDTTRHGQQILTSDGAWDGFVAKYAPSGAQLWVKQLGGTGNLRALDLVVDGNGHPVVTGWFSGEIVIDEQHRAVADHDDVFIVSLHGHHFSGRPHVNWAKFLSGAGRDVGRVLAVGNRGELYVGGSFQREIYSGTGGVPSNRSGDGSDCFVMKLAAGSGRHQSTLHMPGDGHCEVQGLAVDSRDAVVVAGRYSQDMWFGGRSHRSRVGYNGFVGRFTDRFTPYWTASVGDNVAGCSSSDARGTDVSVNGQDGIYLIGHAKGCLGVESPSGSRWLTAGNEEFQAYLVRFSRNGTVHTGLGKGLGELVWGADAFAYDVSAHEDGGYVACGSFASPSIRLDDETLWSQGSGHDVWIARFSPSDRLLWAETFGDDGDDRAFACDMDTEGYVAATGRFYGTIQVGDASPVPSAGRSDAFTTLLAP